MYSSRTLAPGDTRSEPGHLVTPTVTTQYHVFSNTRQQDTDQDDGFAGVAVVTQLPRFNIDTNEEEDEKEDIVSSEAFRNFLILECPWNILE